jgi:D-glycero-D-manno-heptose 1,7-bisphosphate phosphatase
MKNKAIFLDRDGTVIIDKAYLNNVSEIEFIKGVPETLKALKKQGYLLIIVSNQSGVARGYYQEDTVNEIHREMNRMLSRDYGITLDAFYYCPHHPDYGTEAYRKNCDCRKPAPGMVLKAAKEHQIDICQSFMIGDKPSDRIDLPDLKFIKTQKDIDWTELVREYVGL